MRVPGPWFVPLVVACLSGGGLAWSDEAPPPPSNPPLRLTLQEARRLALEQSFELLAAKSDLDRADAQRTTAHAFPNPNAFLSLDRFPLGASTGTGGRDTIAGLNQLVELGGKRGDRVRSAEAGFGGSAARFEIVCARLDANVVKAYVAALVADETVRVNRLSAASLARSAEIAGERFAAGEISEAEKEQVGIAAGRFEADVRTAEATATQARIALLALLGFPRPDGMVELGDDLGSLAGLAAAPAARDLSPEGRSRAGEARGDVKAAATGVQGAAADLSLQKALRVPDVTVTAQYESDQPDNPHTLGFSLSLPVPLFDRNQGPIRAAQVAQDAAGRELARVRAQAQAEIETARSAYEAAARRRALINDGLLPRAEKVEQTVVFSYEKGGASLLELLEAERNLNDLRLAALGTQAEALSAAADLAAALGGTLP
jgi:outer membrane protein, heavy metal efflux system